MSIPPPLPDELVLKPPSPLTVRTAVVHISMLAVVALLLLKVVPTFTKIFKDFDAALPSMTVVMIDMSNWFKDYWFLTAFLSPFYFGGLYYAGLGDKSAQRTWTSLFAIFVVLLVVFALFAMFLPLIDLGRKLS